MKINVGDEEYDIDTPSEQIKSQIENIQFVDEILLQKSNELQIARTAKMAYQRALELEVSRKVNS